jgi:3-deoxy-D-manno-octulosonic acid (KDO) 8-phosphate synthase
MKCSYCGKEIDQLQGYVIEEDENGNIVKAYHPICNALANKLDLLIRNEKGNAIIEIKKGKIITPIE